MRSISRLTLLVILAHFGACSSGSLSQQEIQQYEAEWELYQVGDASWPSVRDRWYEKGGASRELLVDLLLRDLLAQSLGRGLSRPQRELLSLGSDVTLPKLVEQLVKLRDPAALTAVADTLAGFGAVDELLDVLNDPIRGQNPTVRRFALRSLVRSGGTAAIDTASRELTSGSDWNQRAAAADALGMARISDQDRAATALLQGFGDRDPFVARRCIVALGELRLSQHAPAVAAAYARALQTGDQETATDAVHVLRRLTGMDVPDGDPSRWQQVAAQAARNR